MSQPIKTCQHKVKVEKMSLKPIFALFIVVIMLASASVSVLLFLYQMGVFH